MSFSRSSLRVGMKVWYSREQQEVVALNSVTVTTKSMRSGLITIISVAELLTSDGFSTDPTGAAVDTSPEAQRKAIPGGVPEAALAAAKRLLKHVLEAATGYQSGNSQDALPNEPRHEYDPEFTTMTSRIDAKAIEMNCSKRVVWKNHENFKTFGLYGLIDRRAIRVAAVGQAEVVVRAIDKVVHDLRERSNIPTKRIIARVVKLIETSEDLPDNFVVPSNAAIRRYILEREDARRLLRSSKARRNAANRPKKSYTRFHATRPGEVVLIDSTPLDAFALDQVTNKWKSIHLTIAIDLFTRSIVGWRFSADPKAVDAALLLADIISPKRSREWFGDALSKPFVGIPESIVTRLCTPEEEDEHGYLVNIPFLHPESVLIDQGKVFISETFCMACCHLGINVMLARPYTPTDKAEVERMFRTIRENFVCSLPGYTGPDIYSRGSAPEEEAYYYIHEIDELFREWVSTYWQVRQHDGLFLSAVPSLELTPNQMLSEGIARAGFMTVLPEQDMYYQLLPVVWRVIHDYGVEVDGLRYDAPVLGAFTNLPSHYTEPVAGKWPFRQDPRDKSVLIFYDPNLKNWHEIPWSGASSRHRPFDDKTLAYAKELAFKRFVQYPSPKHVEIVLREFLDRVETIGTDDHKLRQHLALSAMKANLADADRKKSVGKRVTTKDPFGSNGSATTARKDPSQSVKSNAPDVPVLIREVSDDLEDDLDGKRDTTMWEDQDESSLLKVTIKSLDDAIEDDEDDLAY